MSATKGTHRFHENQEFRNKAGILHPVESSQTVKKEIYHLHFALIYVICHRNSLIFAEWLPEVHADQTFELCPRTWIEVVHCIVSLAIFQSLEYLQHKINT